MLGSGVLAGGSLSAPAATPYVAFAPTDDTYVNASAPDLPHGTAVEARVDAYPLRRTYLRFEVSGITSPVARATLRIYSRTAHWLGLELRSVTTTTWDEQTLTYTNAPGVSPSVVASSGAIGLGTWVELDVTPLVVADGPVAFALTTRSVTNLPLAMKESGETLAPHLIIETEPLSSGETTPPPADTTTPSESATTQTETTATDATTPTEPPPPDTTPTDTTTQSDTTTTTEATTPTETTATETTPTESSPTESTPTESTPTETAPTETAPTESIRTETTGTDAIPTEPTPAPDTTPPSVPAGLAVTAVTQTSVAIAWNAASDDVGVTGYGVYRDGVAAGATAQPTFLLTQLVCGTSYSLAVDAHDATGNRSNASSTLTVATSPCPDLLAPSVPANLRAVAATASTVSIVWDDSIDDLAVTGYRVYRDNTFTAATRVPAYTFAALECGLGYQFGVDAYDAAGNVSARATLTAVTAPCASVATVAIAGDIAGDGQGDSATAALLDALQPTAVLTAGDNAYDEGSLTQYTEDYDPTWGRHKALTYPTPGNHEYLTTGAAGYFRYFGARAGESGKGWYSFDIGSWHLIALNSEVAHGATSEQVTWLKNDLAASASRCVLAYWHKPRFSAGAYGDRSEFQPFWDALYAAGAELVVNGHDHNYQRYAPMTPTGTRDDERGIREFVVGTGGRSHYGVHADSRREAADATSYGVLKLTLRDNGYDWKFMPELGKTFTDVGTSTCH